jgi:hypothetical protein
VPGAYEKEGLYKGKTMIERGLLMQKYLKMPRAYENLDLALKLTC